MKVKGEIEVLITEDGKTVNRVCTTNTFTNVGKQLICDWLKHDNFSIDVDTAATYPEGGGRSLSAMKMVPYTEITSHTGSGSAYYNGTPNVLLHPIGSCPTVYSLITSYDYSYFRHWTSKDYNYGAMYFEFTEPKSLVAFLMGTQMQQDSYNIEWQVAVSPSSYAANNTWTVVGYFTSSPQGDDLFDIGAPYREQMIRLQHSVDSPDIFGTALENVKTIRLAVRTTGTNMPVRAYGIWFFEQNFYPNNPSVIALGTGNTAPSVGDTILENEDNRGWLNTVEYHDGNKITFSRKLEADESNDIEFKEVGLMFYPDKGRMHGGGNGPELATGLFARAVFQTPWQKNSSQCATINYTISLI